MTDLDKWYRRYLGLAEQVAGWSKDKSTKVGSVITKNNRVISLGYNGLPEKLPDDDDILDNREIKLAQVIHSEINAILTAKQDLTGCSIFTWPFPPCSQCASVIIQAGITTVVSIDNMPERWKSSFELSIKNFNKAGVNFYRVSNLNVD